MRIVGGVHRGKKLFCVGKDSTRETADMVKEAVFNMLGGTLDGVVLDLFAGSGAYGLEALSRGASFLYAVDKSKDAIKTIIKNSKNIKEERVKIINKDYLAFLKALKIETQFNLVFLDPPYALNVYESIMNSLEKNVLTGGFIVCESKKDVILSDNIISFAKVKEKTYGIKRITIYQKQ